MLKMNSRQNLLLIQQILVLHDSRHLASSTEPSQNSGTAKGLIIYIIYKGH